VGNVKIVVTRTGKIRTNLDNLARSIGQKVEKALEAGGTVLLHESQKLVPLDTEALADSGRIQTIGSLFNFTVFVGYGGFDFPARTVYSRGEGRMVERKPWEYALFVHEDMTKYHPDGQANYLGQPVLTNAPEIQQAIRNEMR
jgi:hypothetical protein